MNPTLQPLRPGLNAAACDDVEPAVEDVVIEVEFNCVVVVPEDMLISELGEIVAVP